ncbi:MAG TPA: STAS domain-containing protein [Bryobacteraceae bacterium]|nr:STAS domain-containing protein [Bryobacteraceae bacterium]
MLKIDVRFDRDSDATVALAGKCCGNSLGELRRAIQRARQAHKHVVLDLSEVTLLDKPSAQFLAAQAREDVTLRNCPEYIQPWIYRECSQ